MITRDLIIQGMSCDHCVMSIRKELSKLANVTVEDVQIGRARVQYDDTKVKMEDLARAVEEAGYKIVSN